MNRSVSAVGSSFRLPPLLKALVVPALLFTVFYCGQPAASAQTFSNESAWTDGTNLYYKASYTGSYAHFNVYLDTDTNASTGYTINGVGGDYLIEDTGVYKSTANGSSWSWGSSIGTATITYPVGGTVQFAVALSVIGNPAAARVAFQGTDVNWVATLDPHVVSTGVTYYVSTSGNDANAGTLASPWRTGQKAGNSATAGSTVYFRAGTYAPFDVNVSGSSSAGYVTFTNYPGEAAIIDGTGWSSSYDHGLIHILDRSYIKVIGFEIRNGASTSSSFGPCGIFVQGYSTPGSNIQILNNNVHNITNTATSGGNAHGILVRGENSSTALTNVTVSGNQVANCQTGWSETVTFAGNLSGFTASNNSVHDNNNIGIVCTGGYSGTAGGAQGRNGVMSGNTVYNCSTLHNPYYNSNSCAGLYVDGGTSITIERNTVHNCDMGIAASSENVGCVTSYVTARNNVLYQNAMSGIRFGGYAASGTGGTDHCTFVNNTLYNNDTNNWWCGEISIGWRATNNVFDNNIVYAGSQDVFVDDVGTDGSAVGTFDYNEYYSTGGNANAKWRWINQANWTMTLASWQSLSGQDAHSTFADPLLISLTTPNLDNTAGSPARGSGTNLGSTIEGTVDFIGNTRVSGAIDKGAYEH